MAERPLIGVSPDQVSTNGMLGDLAFQDSDGAYIETIRGAVSLDKLDKEITDTAVDIFVYDTRKDSDGGAWRKRTQHTSWYNETLNTATRGSRREFPSVAVIVAESNQVTIYDGDDPDLPMWMVFINEGQVVLNWSTSGNNIPNSVESINGILCLGSSVGGVILFNFIKDDIKLAYFTYSYELTTGRLITDRNNLNSGGWRYPGDGYIILSNATNDVAMTVLPNAPIDPATGLPIPTIAVATDGGVSVIKDDGTVTNWTADKGRSVTFDDQYRVVMSDHRYSTDNSKIIVLGEGYSSRLARYGGTADSVDMVLTKESYNAYSLIAKNGHIYCRGAIPDYSAVQIIYQNDSSPSNGMHCVINDEYNTGWMHGNIKGAFLSDTNATNVTGTELVTNGTFGTALGAEWTLSTGAQGGTIALNGSNQLVITQGSASAVMYASQAVTTVVGKTYVAVVTVVSTTEANYFRMWVGTSINGSDLGTTGTLTTAGTYSITFTATSTTSYITLNSDQNATRVTTWDNASVRLAELDRSVNNKGLQVFGTITKSAVATGADLVGYSGFSTSNYLEQPYNSALDFGTGDFTICFWMKTSRTSASGYGDIVSWGNLGAQTYANATKYLLFQITGNPARLLMYYNASGSTSFGIKYLDLNKWQFICLTRSGNNMNLYIDGRLSETRSETGTFTPPSSLNEYKLKVGYSGPNYSYPASQESISLLRLSVSVPSPEQIKKIYEDEKVLFQENAACTLYGSSDAVTALAYDDSTNLLYAGTSSGRSDFQGLRRINNTTTAVTTAISASNGLIAEQ